MSQIQTGLLVLLLTFLGVVGYNVYLHETTPEEMSYSEFISCIEDGKIKEVHLKGGMVTGENISKTSFSSFVPDVPSIMPLLKEKNLSKTS